MSKSDKIKDLLLDMAADIIADMGFVNDAIDDIDRYKLEDLMINNIYYCELREILKDHTEEPRLSQKQLLDDIRDGESTRLRDEFVAGVDLDIREDGTIVGKIPDFDCSVLL